MLIHYCLPFLQKMCIWEKRNNMMKLYNEGKRRIDRDLNVIRLVKNLNILKIFITNNLMNDKVRWQVAHCDKNIINIDTESQT